LPLSKWTAVNPQHKEKHFIVTKTIEPLPPNTQIEQIELEAVYSRRIFIISWRDLTNVERWLQGWK
jgi:tryptophan-rich hypothetical protein